MEDEKEDTNTAVVAYRGYKREPGWYWFYDGVSNSDRGKCGPFSTHSAAAKSARRNGFTTVTEFARRRKGKARA